MTILEPPSEARWVVSIHGSDEADSKVNVHDAGELARVVAVAAMLGQAKRITITTPDEPTCDHDPIETGREAALGQWEARWEALRNYLSNAVMPVASHYLQFMDEIAVSIPTGLPVGERWVPRIPGRVNLQLEPERVDRLIELLKHIYGMRARYIEGTDAMALAEDIRLMAERQR